MKEYQIRSEFFLLLLSVDVLEHSVHLTMYVCDFFTVKTVTQGHRL